MSAPDQIVALAGVAFADIAAAIESKKFVRDPDRGGVEIVGEGRPSFASWSGADGDDREVDFHHDGHQGITWLEIRGGDAETLAESLATELCGRRVGSVEDLIVGLMTASSATRRQGRTEKESSRWHRLQAALAVHGEANAVLVRSLIRAGLLDPDWRVRMTAMLAVGRLRLSDLAPLASKARVPQAGRGGIRQEDRRMLLALRQACHDFALGLPPSAGPGDGTDAAIAALRREFQAKLHRLLGGEDIDDLPARAIFRNLTGESSLEASRRRR
jgi:hypothetical protein